MTTSIQIGLYHTLLVAYVLAVVCLNLLAYLISDFYRKKFNQPSPRSGFLAAVILGLCIVVVSLFRNTNASAVELLVNILMITGGMASLLSAIGLYITMRKVRK